MNKKNKILALSSSCLLLISLVSCDVTATPKDGVLLEFSNGDVSIGSREVFDHYIQTKEGVEAVYEQVNDAVARHIVTNSTFEEAGKKDQLIAEAAAEVDDIKAEAENNAKTNKTSYDDELEKLLDNNGADDIEELTTIFENKKFRAHLKDFFFEKFIDELKIGGEIKDADTSASVKVDSYVNDILPYHVKHILVKVSAGESNYTTSTITEAETVELSSAIKSLAFNTTTSFGQKAVDISDDTGSAADYGDLGLMSINTSYVNEFKLGIYTYETLFNSNVDKSDATVKEKVNNFLLDDNANTKAYKEYLSKHGLNFIPSGIADLLYEERDNTLDTNNEKVNDGKEQYYPRNILWNQYLNKHEVSFIEYADVAYKSTSVTDPTDKAECRNNDNFISVTPKTVTDADLENGFVRGTNFKAFQFNKYDNDGNLLPDKETRYILTDGNRNGEAKPIIVTRAGTGEGEQGYQGIHFIVVERSALIETTADGVSLNDYYTTKLPNANGNIDWEDDTLNANQPRVYVNAFNDTQKAYQSRVDKLIQEIKEADNSIDKKINEYYKQKSGAKIVAGYEGLEDDLAIFYDAGQIADDEEAESELVAKWQEYVRMLERQNIERESEKLIPIVCAINFKDASNNDEKGELFGIGGVCHYVEQKA